MRKISMSRLAIMSAFLSDPSMMAGTQLSKHELEPKIKTEHDFTKLEKAEEKRKRKAAKRLRELC